jgi:hypothetical protein
MEWICGLLGFFAVLFVLGFVLELIKASWKGSCGVCNATIRKTSYRWKIDGKMVRMCPRCNSRMEGRQSRSAFDARFGR